MAPGPALPPAKGSEPQTGAQASLEPSHALAAARPVAIEACVGPWPIRGRHHLMLRGARVRLASELLGVQQGRLVNMIGGMPCALVQEIERVNSANAGSSEIRTNQADTVHFPRSR